MTGNIGKGITLNKSLKVYDDIKRKMINVDPENITATQWYDTREIYKIAKNLSETRIFSGGGKTKKQPKIANTDEVNGVIYQNLAKQPKMVNFFEAVANKTQGANEFMSSVVKLDQTSNIMTNKSNSLGNLMNFESLYKNVKKVQEVLNGSGNTIAVFDLETISGINQFGHSILSNITEISGVQFAINNHTAKVQRKMNTVLGFTKAEADDARRKLSGMMSRGKSSWTNEEKVFYERMNIYGNSKARQNGFDFQIYEAKGIEDIKTSRLFAEDGIKFLEDVANQQTEWLRQNGINDTYEQYRMKQLQEFKKMLQESTIAQGHNVQGFDIRQLNIATGDNTPLNNVFDTLQPANRAMAEFGAESIYAKGANRTPVKTGRATQATLAEAHNLKDKNLAAHIAENDVMENALFLFGDIKGGSSYKNGEIQISNNSYFNNVILPNMEKLKTTYDKTSSLYKNNNQLFYMDYTMQKNFANQDGALSFEYDPMTKSFKTFDGYTIKDGKVSNSGYPAFGPRKGAVYQHGVYEIEMNDKFKEQFMNITGAGEDQANKIFQQYANANKLYMIESKQYMDLDELTKKLGSRELAEHYYNNRATTYTFETNFDRLGANLGINIGEVVDGGVSLNKEAIRGLNFKRTQADSAGGAIVKSTDMMDEETIFNKIISKSYDRTINDSAARKLRNLDYKQVMQIRNYQKEIVEQGIQSNTPIVTRISQMVSKGKDIDLTTHSEIINALGWHDFRKKEDKIVKETINNVMALDGYVNRMGTFFDAMDQVLNETYGIVDISTPSKFNKAMADPKNREILWKKDMAFKQLFNDFLDDIGANPGQANMWAETYHTAAELNKIDFNMFDINPDAYSKKIHGHSRNLSKEVTAIDLNKPDSLINTFYNAKFGDLDKRGLVDKQGNAGYDALLEAYNTIRADERFHIDGKVAIFNDIDINDRSRGVTALNDAMVSELRNFATNMRATDNSWGYINPRMNMDVLSPGAVDSLIQGASKEDIINRLNKLKSNLPTDFKLLTNDQSHKDAVNTLVNEYFMAFSKEDLLNNMDGMTANQRRYVERQYESALETAQSKADSLLRAIKGTDIDLFMTNSANGPVLSLVQGDNVQELSDMFRFKNRQGMITYAIGDNEYAFKSALGRYKTGDRKGTFKFSNNVERITDGNLDHMHAMWAQNRGDSIIDAIAYNNKAIAQKLRDTSARIDLNNGQLHALGFQFDANELITALPDLYNKKVIESIETKYSIGDSAKESMRKMIDRIRTNPHAFKEKGFTKVLPVELNFFTGDYMAPLLEEIFKNTSYFTDIEREILKEVGVDTKNTALFKGFLSGVSNYYIDPLAKMDNDARPPVTQMQNTRLYNKKETVEDVIELRSKNEIYDKLNATSVYTSDNMEKYLYNNMSSTGEAATSGLTMKYMQVDSYTLRNQFLDKKNISKMDKYLESHANKSDLERAKEVVRDRAKRLSTYEQQSNMDARVHDISFYQSNTQTINAKKKMIANHKDNLKIIEYIGDEQQKYNKLHFTIGDNGEIIYDLGVKVKKNQVLGNFGNDKFMQEVRAKSDGIFRGRFFDTHGNVVSEDQLESFLQDQGLIGKGPVNNNDIMEALNRQFTFKYEVLGLEEKHGAKAFLGASEKTTIDSMKLAVGEVNSDIVKALKGTDAEDIIGKVVDKRYLEEVVRKQLTDEYGAYKAGEIIESIYDERYLFSDAVHQIDAFKDVQFITNLDVLKHKSATALMHNGLNELRENGQLTAKNLDALFGKGNYELIGEGKDAQVKILSSLKEVDFTSILNGDNEELVAAFTKDTRVYDSNGKAIGHTGIAHINQVIDDSAGTASGVFGGEVIGKGVKFTDAMGRNLDRQTYNLDGLQGVYNHYLEKGQLEEFKATFGHALDMEAFEKGQLAFNHEYKNRSIALPVTERLRNKLVKSDYQRTIEEIAGSEDRDKYMHLIKSVKENKWGNVTVDRAELMYSYARGVDAMEINALSSDAVVNKYIKGPDYKSFKVVDWSKDNPDWLDLQIGGQGQTVINSDLNPYTNNLIIKTGLGGEDEYLAIARMPEIHAGDSIIQKKHIASLTGLQQKVQELKAGEGSEQKVRDHIRGYKSQMQADITGKEGLIKDLTEYRMEQSFMGKGSGIIMAAFDKNGETLLGSGRVDVLDEMNAKVFKNAKFNGKSLNQHYADGRVVDSLFMSESAFRDMGYFDKDYMAKTFGENFSNLNKEFRDQVAGMSNEEAMKHLLSTQGDAFISVRYPEIMQGSDKFTMGYLDTSLKGNEMRVVGPTGMSAKLDFDGDIMNAARVATADGLSRLNAVVGKEVDGELTAIRNAVDSSITTRAITDNAYWEREVNNFMTGKKGYEMTSKAMDLKSIASHKLINGKVYLDGIENKSELELRTLHKQYAKIIEQNLKDDELVKAVGEENLSDYVAAVSWQNKRDMVTAKVYNNAIGETNVTNQKIKSVISGLLDEEASDYEYKSNLLFDFLYQAEEQAISSKSSVEGLTADRAQQWNKSMAGLMKGTGNREAHLETAEKWLNENLRGNMASGLYFAKSEAFQNKIYEQFKVNTLEGFEELLSKKETASKIDDILIKDIMTTIEDVSSMKNASEVWDSLKIASSQSGGSHWLAQGVNFINEQGTNLKTAYTAILENLGEDLSTNIRRAEFINNKQFRESIEGLISDAADNMGKVSTEEKIGGIIDGIGDFAKSASGKKLAMGAVGIAAGIMIAGYVGGRPRPADVHAMEEASDYQTPMEGYQLADPGMMPGGGQQGYVININARTNKGRDQAVQALQQAISSGNNANINIAMNITDNYGNINDRDIERAIMGAF